MYSEMKGGLDSVGHDDRSHALACIIRERPACGVLGGVRSWQTLMGA